MSGTTISSRQTAAVSLTEASQNPVVVTGSGGVIVTGNTRAIYGGAAFAWTIVNNGLVSSQFGYGIYLTGGGVVTNGSSSATIISESYGVRISGDSGTVTNLGHIAGSDAVALLAGGSVSNAAGGAIDGSGQWGVEIGSGLGLLTNQGTITGGDEAFVGVGVDLGHGGTVTNATSAAIYGGSSGLGFGAGPAFYNGSLVLSVAGNLSNFGRIIGTAASGVYMETGGSIYNAASGSLFGGGTGVLIAGGTGGTVVNDGHIAGNQYAGVYLASGGAITNAASAVISGGNYGINSNLGNYHDNADISASGTVTNAGTIIGQQGTAVVFGGTSQNRLVVVPGATFQGIVIASTKASNTLEFADGGGTLTGIGSEYIGFQTIVVDATAQWTAAGTNTFAANTTLTNKGTLAGLTFTGAGTVRNDGVIQGSAAAGLYLVGGGSIVNAASASIIGADHGVRNIGTVGWQITQTGGTITGTSGDGVSNAGSNVGWDITQAYGSGGTGSGSGTISGGMNGVTNSGTNVTWDITQGYSSQGTSTSGGSSAVITGGTNGASNSGGDARWDISQNNYGKISGGTNGVANYGTGATWDIKQNNYGKITGGTNGASNAGSGATWDISQNNYGKISGGTNGVANSGGNVGWDIKQNANGTISGGTYGVSNSGNTVTIGITHTSGGVYGGTNGVYNSGTAVSVTLGSGTVSGGTNGLASAAALYVYDDGGFVGTSGAGIRLQSGGTVSVGSSGIVAGSTFGVEVTAGAATVTTAGTIKGTGGIAVSLGGVGQNRLVVDPGAVFAGQVVAAPGDTNTLDLASGASVGTLAGLGSNYVGFGQITVGAFASWMLDGTNTISSGQTLTELSGASVIDTGTLENDGAIVLDPSALTVTGLTGTGSVTIDAESTLDAQGTIAGGETLAFGGSGAYLHLDNPGSVAGIVTNFDFGETIDLKGVDPTSVNFVGDLLSFGGGSFALSLARAGTVTASASGDGADVTLACFCANTLIQTPLGERLVQELAVGDEVEVLLGGTAAPIIWIGRRDVDCRRHLQPRKVWPVRVAAGAFGQGWPHSDLWLSPDHAVLVNQALIPVKHLINGSTIVQVPVDRVVYHHVELERHDVLLAEGLPAESFLDMRDGSNYANRAGLMRLYPDYSARMWEAFGCARLVVTGPELEAARAVVANFAPRQEAA
jgi:hypothetical protein